MSVSSAAEVIIRLKIVPQMTRGNAEGAVTDLRLSGMAATDTQNRLTRPNDCSCIVTNRYSPNSTWLVTSRLDTTRSTCRASRARHVERVDPCCSTSSTQPKCMGSTRQMCRVVSCRDVTSQVEFGLYERHGAVCQQV